MVLGDRKTLLELARTGLEAMIVAGHIAVAVFQKNNDYRVGHIFTLVGWTPLSLVRLAEGHSIDEMWAKACDAFVDGDWLWCDKCGKLEILCSFGGKKLGKDGYVCPTCLKIGGE